MMNEEQNQLQMQMQNQVFMNVAISGLADNVMQWLGGRTQGQVGDAKVSVTPVSVSLPAFDPAKEVPEPFPAPEAVAPPAPTRGRRKAAAGQNEPVTPPIKPVQSVKPGADTSVETFPFDDPKPVQPSDMLDFSQIPDGATISADPFRFYTKEQFLKTVAQIVQHIPDRKEAQGVVTNCGFTSITLVPQEKYPDVLAGLLRKMYEKAGKTVHVETPSDNPLV